MIWMILETRGWQIRDHIDRFESSHVLTLGIGLGFASYLLYGALYIALGLSNTIALAFAYRIRGWIPRPPCHYPVFSSQSHLRSS